MCKWPYLAARRRCSATLSGSVNGDLVGDGAPGSLETIVCKSPLRMARFRVLSACFVCEAGESPMLPSSTLSVLRLLMSKIGRTSSGANISTDSRRNDGVSRHKTNLRFKLNEKLSRFLFIGVRVEDKGRSS